MRKKIAFLCIFSSCLIGIGYVLLLNTRPLSHFPQSCPFCNSDVLNLQNFYEDDLVIALCTHKPIAPGHCLVIPKRHVERFEMLDDAEITQMGRVIKKVNLAVMQTFDTSAYLLVQKNGLEAWQSVPHVHFHYIPRQAGDRSTIGFLAKLCIANIKRPMAPEETHKIAEKLKQAMDHAE